MEGRRYGVPRLVPPEGPSESSISTPRGERGASDAETDSWIGWESHEQKPRVHHRAESGAGVDIQPHWPHKNQGDTGDDAENDQFQTECPIRLPRGRNENRSDKRDRKEDERPRRANA